MRPIWMQLEKETDRAYWDFEFYRDMGPGRSLRKAGKRLAKNPKSLAKLSKKYHWRERVRAFDAYVAQRKAEAVVSDAVEMHRRHVETALLIENIARVTLAELVWRLNNTDFLNYNKVSTAQLFELAPKYSKLYMEGADMERVARRFEGTGSEDRLTTIDVKSLLSNREFISSIETLLQDKSDQMISLHKDSQPEYENIEKVERLVESKASSENSAPGPVLRRRTSFVKRQISVVKNQEIDPRPPNTIKEKGEGR